MPGRYRPTTRRHKPKKRTTISDIVAQPREAEEEREVPLPAPRLFVPGKTALSRDEGRHVTRDYSHVRAEVLRIAVLAGLIILGLVLTSIFWR